MHPRLLEHCDKCHCKVCPDITALFQFLYDLVRDLLYYDLTESADLEMFGQNNFLELALYQKPKRCLFS